MRNGRVIDDRHPTKLDRLMHAVAEHHPLRASVELAIDEFRVRIASNSEELIGRLRDYYRPNLTELQDCDLMLVAIESRSPELGLRFESRRADAVPGGRKEEYADIDGGRVVRKAETGLQFLLGSDMTLAVGACAENPLQIAHLVTRRCAELVAQRG